MRMVSLFYNFFEIFKRTQSEWMYELQQHKSKEKWKLYNEACLLMEEEKYEDAITSFESYLLSYRAETNEDICACYMIKKCYKLLQNKANQNN